MEKTLTGRYNFEEIKKGISAGEIKYITLAMHTAYQMYSKRFEANYFLSEIIENGAHMPQATLTFTIANQNIDCEKINSNNIGDCVVKPDHNTYRIMSWLEPGHVIVIGEFLDRFGKEYNTHYPRNILKRLIKTIADKHGVDFKAASELEYYLLNKPCRDIVNQYPKIDLNDYRFTNQFSCYSLLNDMDGFEQYNKKIKDNIINCGIELEGLFTEHGPGQHEVNIKYGEILSSSDNHVILKHCIKQTAKGMGIGCTFMAKTFIDQTGSSCHVHISTYKNGNNFWAPSDNDSENYIIKTEELEVKINKTYYYFIGGVIKYLPDLFLAYAPYVNSYKRFKKNSWAPFYLDTWAYDCRTSCLRIIGEGEKLHLELRIGSADANPYLAYSAVIASGMKGVEDKIIPPPMQVGNSYNKNDGVSPPKTLYEAIKLFEKSQFAEEVFGKDFRDLYVKMSYVEWDTFLNHVSAYEINRYLDTV
jgi:glutamine synthetase